MKTKKMVYGGILLALGILLPQAFHLTGIPKAGNLFLPMHIPVLLSGFLLGPLYGGLIGLLSPIISFFLTGMPPAERLVFMVGELTAYGLASGFLFHNLKLAQKKFGIYLTLITAMLMGRLVYLVLLTAAAYLFHMQGISPAMALTAVVTGLPGIVIQLVLLPPVIYLMSADKRSL